MVAAATRAQSRPMSAAPAAKRQKVANAKPAKPAKAAPQKIYLVIDEKVPVGESDYKSADTDIEGVYSKKANAVTAAEGFAMGYMRDHADKMHLLDGLNWGPKNGFTLQAIGVEPTGSYYRHVYVKGMKVQTW